MANATADRETLRQDGVLVAYGLGAAKQVYQGTLIVRESTTGYVEKGANGDTKFFVGVAAEGVDNSAGAAGAKNVQVYRHGVFRLPYTGTAPTVDSYVYISDDQTVSASGTTRCGRVVRVYTSTSEVDIDIDIEPRSGVFATSSASDTTGALTAKEIDGRSALIVMSFAGAAALAIPAAATVTPGTQITVKKTGAAGAITITPAAGTIAGGATHAAIAAQNDLATFVALGTDWVLTHAQIA